MIKIVSPKYRGKTSFLSISAKQALSDSTAQFEHKTTAQGKHKTKLTPNIGKFGLTNC
jgi:hypothetical protein